MSYLNHTTSCKGSKIPKEEEFGRLIELHVVDDYHAFWKQQGGG